MCAVILPPGDNPIAVNKIYQLSFQQRIMHDDLEVDSLIPIFQLKFCLWFSWADVNVFF